ncbi:hypothetical protein [Streptomyces sp. x-80]|uniref:hypothetical protein n=1 Tax=Streptomyces sp. x-80 TaxID=2789282 RepID=UPI00397EC33A
MSLSGEADRRAAFPLESLAGPRADRRPEVVGHGRLAEIRLVARHVGIDGAAPRPRGPAPPLRRALGAVAERCGAVVCGAVRWCAVRCGGVRCGGVRCGAA